MAAVVEVIQLRARLLPATLWSLGTILWRLVANLWRLVVNAKRRARAA